MSSRAFVALFAALIASASAPDAFGGYAHLILDSAPGSYIGGGQDYDFTDPNSQAFNVYPSDNLSNGELTNIDFIVFQSGTVNAQVEFDTHLMGIPLEVGQYNNAARFGFEGAGQPGLEVDFYDEGPNTVTGSFDITNVTFYIDTTGHYQIATFAATFDEVAENNTSHVTGSITYSASVPEPSSLFLFGIAGVAVLGVARCRRHHEA